MMDGRVMAKAFEQIDMYRMETTALYSRNWHKLVHCNQIAQTHSIKKEITC